LDLESLTELFFRVFMKYGRGVLQRQLSNESKFPENRPSDSHILLGNLNYFHPYFPYFLTNLGEILYSISLRNGRNSHEFSEN